jgi:hypothetical protein
MTDMDVGAMEPNVGYLNPTVNVVSGKVDGGPVRVVQASTGPIDRTSSISMLRAFMESRPQKTAPLQQASLPADVDTLVRNVQSCIAVSGTTGAHPPEPPVFRPERAAVIPSSLRTGRMIELD